MAAEPGSPPLGTIGLLPIDGLDAQLARELVTRLSRRVGLPCQLRPAVSELPLAELAGRGQLDADRLLAAVEAQQNQPGDVLLGVTGRDIGNPIFAYFFGLARHSGHAGLVSLARLDPAFYGLPADHETTVRRAVIELLHELGHVAGLQHCADAGCLMHFAPTVEALDVRGQDWCGDCAAQLPDELRSPRVGA